MPDPSHPTRHILTLLTTSPPNLNLSLGVASTIPPEPSQFQENPNFYKILYSVLAEHAIDDPAVKQAAERYVSEQSLSSNFNRTRNKRSGSGAIQSGSQSFQGAGQGAGRGGWVHVGDSRRPPEWGRIPDPEDIFGSVEVDGDGKFVGKKGNFQESGTYRLMTREGTLGLSSYLMEKLVSRMKELEREGGS